MASASQSTSHSESQSTSDTYIPEYSESPFLRATAELARARSDQVYQWGMDVYNRNQGSIDGLMRDALSYASPQRIAVDMGMAEAGVQQAGERGRLSAIRDLESYGIDPSSGRYAALDSANRVMTAAAAAGAGNQQRMATQAAGNAMRNQAIAAGLQNANFGLGVGDSANRFLQTAMSLKYPPLGRTSQSTSQSDQQSSSGSGDGGGGKQGQQPKEEKPKQEQQPRQQGQPRGEREQKPQPERDQPPQREAGGPKTLPPLDVKTGQGGPSFDEKGFEEAFPPDKPGWDDSEVAPAPGWDDSATAPGEGWDDSATAPAPDDPNYDPNAGTPISEGEYPGSDVFDTEQELPAAGESATAGGYPGSEVFDTEQELPAYDPYAGQTLVERQSFDPVTGEPVGASGDERVASEDPTGSVYGLDEAGGGWTGDITPAGYVGDEVAPADIWSDIGQGTMEEPTAGEWDSTYDAYTDDPYADLGVPDDQYGDLGAGDYEDPGYQEEIGYVDPGYDDYYDDFTDYDDAFDYGNVDDPYADYGDEDYYDDWNEDDYYEEDLGDYADYGDESYDDPYADYSDEDYYDDAFGDESYDDYGDEDYSDYEDYGDDAYEDYTDDYDPSGDYEDYDGSADYEDAGDYYDDSGGDEYYDDSGGDYSDGGDYARGGPVKRRTKMPIRARGPGGPRPRPRPGMRPRRPRPPMTGYRPRPPMRRPPPRPPMSNGQLPAFARGGTMPPPGRQLDRPPTAPGRMARPQQAPRPQRGAPMAAPGGPQPTPMIGRGPQMPGNFISPNGMPPPTTGGMQRPQRMAGGGQAGRQPEPTQGGFVSRSLSPSGGSTTDDVNARLNAGEFVIPKDVATWKGKEFFYKMIASARKNRSAPNGGQDKPQTGYNGGGMQ